jgi:tRNA1Val (adenine37-N6)-methyltransferase
MSNSYFKFKQFTVYQDYCGMKVGTDGTLLGAWASVGAFPSSQRPLVLDIGTGTGLIALMMTQRFPSANVIGIDIDEDAVRQATENVAASPFADRISIVCDDIRHVNDTASLLCPQSFSAIVCNPPYFVDSLTCPDSQRTLARHCSSLSYRELMASVDLLLADYGELSVVIPFDCKGRLEAEAALAGLSKVRECGVRTTMRKPPRRYLLAFRRHPAPLEKREIVIGSEEYCELTKDFYL